MQKNRKMAGKVCDVIGYMLNFPFLAKLDITNIIILLFSLSIFLISLTPPPHSQCQGLLFLQRQKTAGESIYHVSMMLFTNKKSVQPEDLISWN